MTEQEIIDAVTAQLTSDLTGMTFRHPKDGKLRRITGPSEYARNWATVRLEGDPICGNFPDRDVRRFLGLG